MHNKQTTVRQTPNDVVLLVLVSLAQFVINIVINFAIADCHTYQFERGNTLWLRLNSVGIMAVVPSPREQMALGLHEWLSVSMKKENLASKPCKVRLRGRLRKSLRISKKNFTRTTRRLFSAVRLRAT